MTALPSMSRRARILLTLCTLAGSAGCGPTYHGVFSDRGYENPRRSLVVSAVPGQGLLPPDWRLDNVYGSQSSPKETAAFKTTYEFDTNGDGRHETREDDYAYELRFENVRGDGVIWLRMVPISATDAQKLPRVLIRDYVAAIAGTGFEVTVISPGVLFSAEKRFATETIGEFEGTVAGGHAHGVILNVANVDQVQVNQSARQSRVKLVLARTPVEYPVGRRYAFPVVLVAGYSNIPDDFDSGLPVFEDFLRRISVLGVQGVDLRPVRPTQPATGAGAASPAEEPSSQGPLPPGTDAAPRAPASNPSDPTMDR